MTYCKGKTTNGLACQRYCNVGTRCWQHQQQGGGKLRCNGSKKIKSLSISNDNIGNDRYQRRCYKKGSNVICTFTKSNSISGQIQTISKTAWERGTGRSAPNNSSKLQFRDYCL